MFPTTQNSTADIQSFVKSFKVAVTPEAGGGKSFVQFDAKTGVWAHGREGEDITGEQIAVNTTTLVHGWTLWHNRKPTKIEVSVTEDLPMPMDSITNPNGKVDAPSESRGFEARFTDGDETILSYGGSTYGARKGVDALTGVIAIRSSTEEVFLYPVVTLTSESYENAHQGGALCFNPVLEIQDWMDGNGNLESATGKLAAPEEAIEEAEDEPEAPVKKKRQSKRAD
tara:strand:- start:442 stop:1122 length:681 start_codon:yes stop_codon:yes gene_type:complete